ncbi:MAG: hypothetical protein ACP5Q1_03435 [Anaerolineae bacterium]
MKILSLIQTYSLWIYIAGFLAALFSLRELRKAQKDRKETIFTLEKELATVRENRARTSLILAIGLLAALTLVMFVVIPAQPIPVAQEPTATSLLAIELPTSTPAPPTPTMTRIPTRPRPTPLPPTPTATATSPPPPPCPQPGVQITSPVMNQVVSGQVTILGTAQIDRFQFYKLEYGMGENPAQWHSIGEVNRTPVVNGVLGVWNTTGFPSGVFTLRLTVVDITGNFPPPCDVQVIIK